MHREALGTVEVVSKMLKRKADGVNMAIIDPKDYLSELERIDFAKVLSEAV